MQRPSRATVPANAARDLITIAEAAKRAGVNKVTIYRALKRGELYRASSGPVRLKLADVEEWAREREQRRERLYMTVTCCVCGGDLTRLRSKVRPTKSGEHYCGSCSQYARSRLRGPSIAARRQREAELYRDGLTLEEVGQEVGVALSTVERDLEILGVPRRSPSDLSKYPPPEERTCIRPGCEEKFTPTRRQIADGKGWYHSPLCARQDEPSRERAREVARARHRRADEKLAAIKAQRDVLTVQEVASMLAVAENTISGEYIPKGFLAAEQVLLEGEKIWLIERREFDRFKLKTWPEQRNRHQRIPEALIERWSPKSRSRWKGRRSGYKGAAGGIEAGRAKGGRPPVSTPQEQQEMLQLDREGYSTRKIAERVFGDRRYKDRVARFLRR